MHKCADEVYFKFCSSSEYITGILIRPILNKIFGSSFYLLIIFARSLMRILEDINNIIYISNQKLEGTWQFSLFLYKIFLQKHPLFLKMIIICLDIDIDLSNFIKASVLIII